MSKPTPATTACPVEHTAHREVAPGVWEPAQPISPGGLVGLRMRRACHKHGGHYWHYEAAYRWYCCRCPARTEGMPRNGSADPLTEDVRAAVVVAIILAAIVALGLIL